MLLFLYPHGPLFRRFFCSLRLHNLEFDSCFLDSGPTAMFVSIFLQAVIKYSAWKHASGRG